MIYNVHVLYFLCVNLKLILDNNLSLRNNPTVVREVKLTLYQIRLSILHYTQASKILYFIHHRPTPMTRIQHFAIALSHKIRDSSPGPHHNRSK